MLTKSKSSLKKRLDLEVEKRNYHDEISYDKPDPLLVARRYQESYSSLAVALFSYGRADSIVKFLDTIDMALLDASEVQIKKELSNHYYRFQNSNDVIAFFIALRRIKTEIDLEDLFLNSYHDKNDVIDGINGVITKIYDMSQTKTQGFNFLVGKPIVKIKGHAPMKRWMMFLRWMVRDDNIDMGLWSGVDKKDLLMPLDTHTFKVSQKLGLLNRKTYDLESVILLTEALKKFDKNDPVKYDFALYRLGQEKLV
jgi:uncharacterized protein (TIGR02757 family)